MWILQREKHITEMINHIFYIYNVSTARNRSMILYLVFVDFSTIVKHSIFHIFLIDKNVLSHFSSKMAAHGAVPKLNKCSCLLRAEKKKLSLLTIPDQILTETERSICIMNLKSLYRYKTTPRF